VSFVDLPPHAGWVHEGSRTGFETVFARRTSDGYELSGHTAAVEDGQPWAVHYVITVDDVWRTRRAHVTSWTERGRREVLIEADGAGRWLVAGQREPDLDGCLDVDLESSACTNTLPVHRLRLAIGDGADAPAAYVRALDLGVERLEQRYARVDDGDSGQQYDYAAPAFEFEARLTFDATGLVVRYPGIARRVV